MADIIDELVEKITRDLKAKQAASPSSAPSAVSGGAGGYTTADYPFLEKHPDIVNTPTGKPVSAVTMEAVRSGEIQGEDLRISREMLLNQAQVAQSAGKRQMAENLKRAAELTGVPDDQVIRMYDMLRPNRATKQQLVELADTLENTYQAALCAKLVREATAIYEKRGILLP